MSKKRLTIAGLLLFCGLLLGLRGLLAEDRVVLLSSRDGADWLRWDRPFNSGAQFTSQTKAMFTTEVFVPKSFQGSTVEVNALRRVVVSIDDQPQLDFGPEPSSWKQTRTVRLPVGLSEGKHLLKFAVSNRNGPSMLKASCRDLHLKSNSSWLASEDGIHWTAAARADREWEISLPPQFGHTAKDLLTVGPYLLTLFCVSLGVSGIVLNPGPWFTDWSWRIRGLLLIAWVALSANNIFKVPLNYGHDVDSHQAYIEFVAEHLTLPAADAGWQTFQAPLYYIVSGLFDRLLRTMGFATETTAYLLRTIPLLCGGTMIEICYRAGRSVFPQRRDLQVVTTAVGGLLPMNIYMAQAVSNEPLAAVFSGLTVLASLRLLIQPEIVKSGKSLAMMGAIVSLALLTKISAVIYILPLVVAIAAALWHVRATLGQWFISMGIVTGISVAFVSGYLIRNLLTSGTLADLAPALAPQSWWQDPGYRTPRMFYEFGHVFDRCIYNGLDSLWDSVYGSLWGNGILSGAPSWNYRLMSCGLWLAIVPMLLMILGASRAILGPRDQPATTRNCLRISILILASFILALLYVYLTLPIYSIAKASYMLGAAPCIGLLVAGGFDLLAGHRWLRSLVGAAVICWAVTAYMTFFVL